MSNGDTPERLPPDYFDKKKAPSPESLPPDFFSKIETPDAVKQAQAAVRRPLDLLQQARRRIHLHDAVPARHEYRLERPGEPLLGIGEQD